MSPSRRVALAAAVAVSAVVVSVPAGASPVIPARVQVAADEYSLTLSRLKIKGGPAIIQLANFGEDAHDLRFQRAGGTRVYAIKKTAAGDDTDLEVKLLPGRFTLWCSLPGHRKLGMQATLVVTKATK